MTRVWLARQNGTACKNMSFMATLYHGSDSFISYMCDLEQANFMFCALASSSRKLAPWYIASLSKVCLQQGSACFSCQGPASKYFRACGSCGLSLNSSEEEAKNWSTVGARLTRYHSCYLSLAMQCLVPGTSGLCKKTMTRSGSLMLDQNHESKLSLFPLSLIQSVVFVLFTTEYTSRYGAYILRAFFILETVDIIFLP